MNRIILHVDMDAYFATVAKLVDPSLEGKPVVVGSDKSRGIVSTASYEARKYGIHSAMPIYQAKELCKDLIIVNPNFELYEKYTFMFTRILRKYCKRIEMMSVDECFLDMSKDLENVKNPLLVINNIQKEIKDKLGLSCSIGVASNKFLAKMASDMKKPYGITVLKNSEIKDKLWPLEINKMFGIGKKTAPLLKEIGINTIGDLANFKDVDALYKILGNRTLNFIDLANGIEHSEVKTEHEVLKSVGHSRTFDIDITDKTLLKEKICQLSKMVSERAKDDLLVGNSVQLTLKYNDFTNTTHHIALFKDSNEYNDIKEAAIKSFEESYQENRPVRLVGVALKNVKKANEYQKQLSIFDEEEKQDDLRILISKINKTIGKNVLTTAREAKK